MHKPQDHRPCLKEWVPIVSLELKTLKIFFSILRLKRNSIFYSPKKLMLVIATFLEVLKLLVHKKLIL